MTNRPFARFYFEAVENGKRTREEGRPCYDQVEFVEITHPARKDFAFVGAATADHKKNFPEAYEHFLRTEKEPQSGTPLKLVPIFSVDQIATLKALDIKTLEDFTGVRAEEVPQEFKALHKTALTYLDAANDKGALARKFAQAEKENIALRQEKKELQSELAAANEELRALKGDDDEEAVRRRPGRPKKQAA